MLAKHFVSLFLFSTLVSACRPASTTQLQPTAPRVVKITTTSTSATPTDSLQNFALEVAEKQDRLPSFNTSAWTHYRESKMSLIYPDPDLGPFEVFDIEEGPDGVMWFATSYGLVRFDGADWQLVTGLNWGRYVEITTDNTIWFTLDDGIYTYKNDETILMLDFEKYGLGYLKAIEISPSGDVWVVSDQEGIQIYNGATWESQTYPDDIPFSRVGGLAIDEHGRVYISGGNTPYTGGLAYYENRSWRVFDEKDISAIFTSREHHFGVGDLTIDEEGHVWFYVWRQGLFKFADGEFEQVVEHDPEILFAYHPDTMAIDQAGNVWLGNSWSGTQLVKYIQREDEFQSIDGSYDFYIYLSEDAEHAAARYAYERILPFENVSALYVTKDQILWVASELGLYTFDLN